MPPKSARLRMRSGGHAPPPLHPQEAALPLSNVPDPVFDFLSLIPSPVMCGPVPPAPCRSQAAAAAAPLPSGSSDPFAFLAMVPNPVAIPSSQLGQESGPSTRSAPEDFPHPPSFPHPSQLATLPAHMAAGDSAVTFMAMAPPLSTDTSVHSGQGVDVAPVLSQPGKRVPDKVRYSHTLFISS
jgi:hypothetical protein